MRPTKEKVSFCARKNVSMGREFGTVEDKAKSGGFPCFVPDMLIRFCILLLQSLLSLGKCPITT